MSHRHTGECWASYEPCGEHHRHDHNCGGGKLSPACPQYLFRVLGNLEERAAKIEAQAKKLGDEIQTIRQEIKRHRAAVAIQQNIEARREESQ